ncbi:1,4-dihydroxy-2-naphthoate polyprenyltransferase [Chungangia koreensis]|uniref:1,4-dihydroxy-2-naphthoate octaprenyltransferase n=1 Tax=Chungangia koreensis TaxID=752657 RepID=A0ABV8X4T5_9LACT
MSNKTQTNNSLGMWWQLARPHTLTAAFVPVILGTVIAIEETTIDWILFAAMLIASILIQSATNMFNEYYDFKRGLDTKESIGIGGAIVRHGVKPKTVMILALTLYGIALLLGIYICMQSSWWLAVVGAVSMLIGYLYTGGPLPIAYTPFGEIFAGLFMGMLIILISFFIQTGTVTPLSILISIPIMILVGLINLSNNLRDIEEDRVGGRKTFAILAGRKTAINTMLIFFLIAYLWIIGLVLTGHLTPWALITLISLPKPLKAIKIFKAHEEPLKVMPAMKNTAQTNTFFGLLLSIGLLIGIFI